MHIICNKHSSFQAAESFTLCDMQVSCEKYAPVHSWINKVDKLGLDDTVYRLRYHLHAVRYWILRLSKETI